MQQDRRIVKDRPFVIMDERGLSALYRWLALRPDFNVINDRGTSPGDKPDIRLGWDTNPGEDFGRWSPSGLIICGDADLRKRAVAICKTFLHEKGKRNV